MLAELVSGEGCAPDEGDGGANPLSRLSKSLLDAGRHRQLAGAARANDAALMHAANAAGSSSAHALLPAMGDHEASFMEAFGRPAQQQQMQQMQQQHMQQQQMQQQQMQQQQMQQQQQQQQMQQQQQQPQPPQSYRAPTREGNGGGGDVQQRLDAMEVLVLENSELRRENSELRRVLAQYQARFGQ